MSEPTPQVELVDVAAGDALDGATRALIADAYEVVLRPSFSDQELPGERAILDPLGAGRGGTLSIARAAGEVVGAALCELDADAGIELLGYLAVRPDRRSLGVGSLLLDHLARRWQAEPPHLVLGEIHDPRRWDGAGDRAGARLAFYARWGCGLLDVPWVQPGLGDGLGRVHDMLLITLALPGPATTVRAEPVARWARTYFVEAEGRVPDDPTYRALWARLTAHPELRVLPLEEYRSVEPLAVRPA